MQRELKPFTSDQWRIKEDNNTKDNRHWRQWHVAVEPLDLNKTLGDSLPLKKHL